MSHKEEYSKRGSEIGVTKKRAKAAFVVDSEAEEVLDNVTLYDKEI